MKVLLLATVITLAATPWASAQTEKHNDALEQEIRRLEMRDAEAVLSGDFAVMERSWAEDFTVNSPNNQITRGREKILKLIRAGDIGTYSTFVREIESVTIHADVAIVMGLETVKRTSKAAQTGQAVRRRYMNIWTKREGEWLLTARQANVICQN
jgi:ketosteroid isomerase-like protein